jgi:Fe-only nitrogenase accessory protein AnfO
MEIAVLSGAGGGAPFYEKSLIMMVSDSRGSWESERTIGFEPFRLDGSDALAEIHRRMQHLIGEIGECRAFVADEIKGIPFAILDSEGFFIWQMEGEPADLYDHIRKTLKERESAGSGKGCSCGGGNGAVPVPEKIADGEYFIDLDRFLKEGIFNSKEILVPFIQDVSFTRFNIICDHVPHWLEKDYSLFGMTLETKYNDGGCVASLSPDPASAGRPKIPYPVSGCGGHGTSCFEG